MPKPRTVAEAWASYHREVIPKDAGPVQVQESQRNFYAGALAAFRIFIVGPADEPEELVVARLDALFHELRAFGESVGAAGPKRSN